MVIVNAFAALIIYGGWAIVTNFQYGPGAYWLSGLAQGLYAFVSTLSITVVARYLYGLYGRYGYGAQGVVAAYFSTAVLMLTVPLSLHFAVATPNILPTILPGFIGGLCYLTFIFYLMQKTCNQTG